MGKIAFQSNGDVVMMYVTLFPFLLDCIVNIALCFLLYICVSNIFVIGENTSLDIYGPYDDKQEWNCVVV